MNMQEWAEKEIELACKRENPDWDGESFDYGCACYESALKAYKSLLEDGHSGFSWSLTRNILTRLMNEQPLTPITDDDFKDYEFGSPQEYLDENGLKSSVQCPRMASLFRDETLDGKVSYNDVDRYYCFEVDNPKDTYLGGGASDILNELFPITMPYYPPRDKYQIACDTFLVDETMGDFDTKGYLYIITPEGEKVEVNKFYKEIKVGEPEERTCETVGYIDEDGNEVEGKVTTYMYQLTECVEISKEEFENRKAMAEKNK